MKCECGCGQIVKPGNRFIHGHQRRGCKLSGETKNKISNTVMGHEVTEKTRKQIGLTLCGHGVSEKTRAKIGEANRGENNGMYGKQHSKEVREKISKATKGHKVSKKAREKIGKAHRGLKLSKKAREKIGDANRGREVSEKTRKKLSEANRGHEVFEKTRKKISASHQRITYNEWESFACEQKYCPAFNEKCRESNREKYGRRCFLTGLPESKNITSTGNHRKLSVHHIDMDKMQGCDGVRWKLVPLCMEWHGKIHNELWTARITWLLNNVW